MTRPKSKEAHKLFLKGEKAFNAFRRQKLDESRGFFEQAMEIERQQFGQPYPRAMAELVYVLVTIHKQGLHAAEEAAAALEKARSLAPAAVSADPDDYNNHWASGFYHAYSGASDGPNNARQTYQRALQVFNESTDDLDRKPALLSDMGDVLVELGDTGAGLELTWRAVYDVPPWYRWNLANAFYAAGKFAEARDELDKIGQRPPVIGQRPERRLRPNEKGYFYPALPLHAATLARLKQRKQANDALKAYTKRVGQPEASKLLMAELLAPPHIFSDRDAKRYHVAWVTDLVAAGALDLLDREALRTDFDELLRQLKLLKIPVPGAERRRSKQTKRK